MKPVQPPCWPAGVPHTMAVPRTTLPAALLASAKRVGDKPAIVYGGAGTSYAQLARRVDALAACLQQHLGVAAGDRVLVIGQNGPQWVTAAYAVMRAGAVLVPVNPMSQAAEIAFHAADSGARVAIVAQESLPRVPLGDGTGQLAAAVVWAYADAIASDADAELPEWVRAPAAPLNDPRLHAFEPAIAEGLAPGPVPDDPDALAVLPYTSGTTGRPKGCMHTHATLLAALVTSAAWKPVRADSVVLTVAPLFHMLGLQNGMNLPLMLGATAVMMPRWHAPTAAALIERHRVSVWSAPPAMVLDLFAQAGAPGTVRRDFSSLVTLTGGGAPMPEAVAAMLLQRHGLHYQEAYGLTETAAFLHANPPRNGKRQCLGITTPNVDSRIVDPQTLRTLPPGALGELVTHAPQLMRGYWRNEAADRAAFVQLDGRRYFRTGDLAMVDDEGYFFLKDRLKRMVNVSGYKVWPAEVESAMYAHPAVHEACVIAVPDGRSGEAVRALVTLKPGFEGEITAEQMVAWCRERMAVYKAPRQVEFVASLPKSGTGKILWRELQSAHRSQESSPP